MNLFQECLDFVRPPAKGHFTEIQMNDVIPIVLNIVSHIFSELSAKIKVVTRFDPHLPMVYANYEEIKRAFINIVRNGFEAMPKVENSSSRPSLKQALRPAP